MLVERSKVGVAQAVEEAEGLLRYDALDAALRRNADPEDAGDGEFDFARAENDVQNGQDFEKRILQRLTTRIRLQLQNAEEIGERRVEA